MIVPEGIFTTSSFSAACTPVLRSRMRSGLALALLVFVPSVALAAPKQPLDQFIYKFYSELGMSGSSKSDTVTPRIAVLDAEIRVDTAYEDRTAGADFSFEPTNEVIGWAADKQAAWVVVDLPLTVSGGATPTVVSTAHGVAVVVAQKTKWHAVAYSFRSTVPDKEQADTLKEGTLPPKIARKIEPGAEVVAKQFVATIGDPKAFAATVSDRKEVVLLGSAHADRFEGAKVAPTIKKWNLKLAVRDGLQAGLAGTSLAWVVANVDATAGGAKTSVPYQLLAVYEKSGTAWKLVTAQFAFYTDRAF